MDIKSLIPHREPIIMIDHVIDHSEESTITSLTIEKMNMFVEKEVFQSSGLIENIAQSAATRFGIQNNLEGYEPVLGYIASIKNMRVDRLPRIGETIFTKIINKNQINNIIVVQGECKVDNVIISSCELKVFIEK